MRRFVLCLSVLVSLVFRDADGEGPAMTTQPVEHADLEAEHADLLSAGPVPPAEAVTRLRIAGIFDEHDHGPRKACKEK